MESTMESVGSNVLSEQDIHVELTESHLDVRSVMELVKRPDAGAVVMFTGI